MEALTEIVVPDIGDFTDVPVTEILVAVGDAVGVEDPLVAIESDKATMEIPAPVAGTVRELAVAVGDKVSAGTAIVRLQPLGADAGDRPGEADAAATDAAATDAAATDATATDVAATDAAATDVAATDAAATDVAATDATATDAAVRAVDAPDANAPAAPAGDTRESQDADGSVYAGPAVRRAARERGIDLRTVTGTGRRGRITLEDLDAEPVSGGQRAPASARGEAGASGRRAAAAQGPDALGLAPWPSVDFARLGEVERVPLTRIQRLAGSYLMRNWVRIPHVTHNDEADITELEAFRKQLNSEQSQAKVTMVALLLKACTAALQSFPRFNASLDGDELVLKRYYNLGFAADTPGGLVVPVIHDADRKGLVELANELSELSQKARAGKLSPAEMSGSTFTISSLGGIGGTSFTPIINAPEVAILGVVRSATKPVWDGSQFQPRLMLPLSLSYDHRVIDGATAARFCVHLAGLLSDMRRVLL